jgi:hypothetical protein
MAATTLPAAEGPGAASLIFLGPRRLHAQFHGAHARFRRCAAEVSAPLAFVFANFIVYWGGWPTVWRVCVGIAIGVFVLAVGQVTASAQTSSSEERIELGEGG